MSRGRPYALRMIIAGSAIILSGCYGERPELSRGAARPSSFRPNTFKMLACNNSSIVGNPRRDFEKVVRIVIRDSTGHLLDIATMARAVKVKARPATRTDEEQMEDANDLDEAQMGSDNMGMDSENRNNALHVDLRNAGVSRGGWVKVRIVLKNPAYEFYNDQTIEAVGHADQNFRTSFCGAKIKDPPGPVPVAIFYARNRPGTIIGAPFNIGLTPVGAVNRETPIFIDPKVTNSG